MYLVEEIIGKFFNLKHDHSDEGAKEAFENIEDPKCSTPETISDDSSSQRPITPGTTSVTLDPAAELDAKKKRHKAFTNALAFVLALVVHTSLEG